MFWLFLQYRFCVVAIYGVLVFSLVLQYRWFYVLCSYYIVVLVISLVMQYFYSCFYLFFSCYHCSCIITDLMFLQYGCSCVIILVFSQYHCPSLRSYNIAVPVFLHYRYSCFLKFFSCSHCSNCSCNIAVPVLLVIVAAAVVFSCFFTLFLFFSMFFSCSCVLIVLAISLSLDPCSSCYRCCCFFFMFLCNVLIS